MSLKILIALGVWIFAVLAAELTQAYDEDDKMAMVGSVVACRWADFVFQYGSSAENEEQYLFETTGAQPRVIKVIYRHYGYTTLTDKLLSSRPILNLKLRRDRTCDETYGAYTKNAKMITDRIVSETPLKVDPVQFYGKTEAIERLSGSDLLECYVMEPWDFTIIRKAQ
jgi:hypothetical protein